MASRTQRCLIGLGANLGDSRAALLAAADKIAALPGVTLVQMSGLIDSTPVGGPPNQERFTNAAATLTTSLSPTELLENLLLVEQAFGRQRRTRWDARTLDLDLLLYGDRAGSDAGVLTPHPRMSFRPFVIGPAAEVAGDWSHPLLGKTLAELYRLLHEGADRVSVQNADPLQLAEIARRIHEVRPKTTVGGEPLAGGVARLTIYLGEPGRVANAGPTLWLPPGLTPEVQRQEVLAATQCVWPGVG